MEGGNQVCFLCDSKETIKRCVCDSFFQVIDNIQEPISHQTNRRTFKTSDLSYRKTYNLDCKGSRAICISLDGKWIVSSFYSPLALKAARKVDTYFKGHTYSEVQVWNVKGNREYAKLTGQMSGSHSLCISADNRWIVSGGGDRTIWVWNLRRKSLVATLTGHMDYVNSVCVSRDTRWIISGSSDETIRVWSSKTMSEEAVLIGHESSVKSVCLSVDARFIVSGSEDCTVRVWSMKNKSQVAVFRGHTDDVNSVCISSDNNWIASGSDDNTVRLWNMLRNTQEAVFEAMDEVCSVCITNDNRLILSSGSDQKVNVWSIYNKNQEAELTGDERDHSYVTLGQDSIWILSRARRVMISNPQPTNPSNHRTLMMARRRSSVIPPRSNGENLKASKFKLLN